MELDELKNIWLTVNTKLDENHTLNDRIIKEMLQTKSNKSIGRLIGYEIFGICVLLMILPLIVYLWIDYTHITKFMAGSIFLIFMFTVCSFFIIWTSIKIALLIKTDISQKIAENIKKINQYNILIKREKLISVFLLPVIAIFCFYLYIQVNAHIMAWVIMSCLFIVAIIFSIWSYKRIYDKNIKSILDSLEELKDLEE